MHKTQSQTMKRIEIDGTLPFLAPGSAMFLGCEDPASTTPAGLKASQYAACFFELQRELRLLGYRYLYVPELLGSISSDAVSYMFPGCEMPSPSAVYSSVRSRLGLGADVCGFLLNDYGSLSLLPVTEENEDLLFRSFSLFLHSFDYPDDVRFCVSHADYCASERRSESRHISMSAEVCYSQACEYPADLPSALSAEEKLDERAQAIVREIADIQRRYGVSVEELGALLGYTVRISRLAVSLQGRLTLTDFNNTEVRMDPLSKALYLLYLKHPEGIRFKDLADHRDELFRLYMRTSVKDNMDEMRKSIDDIVDPFSNSVNVKVSRIKTAFRNIVNEFVAKAYCVTGPAGGVKSVPLDRDFVIWEH